MSCTDSPETNYRIYNVVPMYIDHESEQAAKCVELYERTGVDLMLYSLTLHPEGKPAKAKVDKYVSSFAKFANALKGTPVRPGVLVQAILGHWPRTDKDIEPWERTVDQDGKKVRFCPLDPGFAEYIDYVFTEIAKAGPAFILTDDDVRAFSHGAECFCDTHMKLFNGRRGTSYTADELREKLKTENPGDADYDTFFKLQREMLEDGVVGRIRAAIDKVDPSINAGVCIAGEEHYFIEPMARRIAAKGQTPVMRCSTGCYCERMTAQAFPWIFFRMLGFTEAYGKRGINMLGEADTCPQNLWSKSARSFYTHLASSAFAGIKGAKSWYVNGIRATGIPVTKAYTDVLASHRGMLSSIVREVAGTKFAGLAMPCFDKPSAWHMINNHGEFFISGTIGFDVAVPFGVPVSVSKDFGNKEIVFTLDTAQEVNRLSDEELNRLFSGKVFVFRDAAVALTARGRADLPGVKAEMKRLMFSSEHDNVRDVTLGCSPELDGSVEFIADGSAEVLTDYVFSAFAGAKGDAVSPATVYFRNALGGEVVTTAYHSKMFSLHAFSEGRKQWFIDCYDKLSGTKGIVCGNNQDVLLSERIDDNGNHLVMVVNLNPDPIETLQLRLAAGSKVKVMSNNGEWADAEIIHNNAGEYTGIGIRIEFYDIAVLKIS